MIKWQWQTDSNANEKHKATIGIIKKTPSLKTQVNLFYENRMYVTACNKVLPYFHSEKLKNYRDGQYHCLLTKGLLTTNVAVK